MARVYNELIAEPSKPRLKIPTVNTLAAAALLENLRRTRNEPLKITLRISVERGADLERQVRLGRDGINSSEKI